MHLNRHSTCFVFKINVFSRLGLETSHRLLLLTTAHFYSLRETANTSHATGIVHFLVLAFFSASYDVVWDSKQTVDPQGQSYFTGIKI